MSTPRSDSLAGIREQAPLEMNVQLTQSLWILRHQSQLPFFGRILRRNPILAKSGNSFRPLTGTPRICPKSYLLSYSLFIAFPSPGWFRSLGTFIPCKNNPTSKPCSCYLGTITPRSRTRSQVGRIGSHPFPANQQSD